VIGYDPAVMAKLRVLVALPEPVDTVVVGIPLPPVNVSLTKLVPVTVNPARLVIQTVVPPPVMSILPDVLNAIDLVLDTLLENANTVRVVLSAIVIDPAVYVYVPVQVTVAVLLRARAPLV
jgi:hypothetical protein